MAELSVTAGNASGVNDGACAFAAGLRRRRREAWPDPRARVVAMATAGVAPRIMGFMAPPAVRKVLAKAGLTLDRIGCDRTQRGFRGTRPAALRDLGLADDEERVDNGGAPSPWATRWA